MEFISRIYEAMRAAGFTDSQSVRAINELMSLIK